jgi:hypothetical protein
VSFSYQQLHDLDELSLRVINRVTRQYVDEAILSYRAGALRAATGAIWVAVCADLIEKIRELASLGDAEAKMKSDRFDAILKTSNTAEMMDFERDLLDVACGTLEIISNSEKQGLERIREDRNKAVHPSFHEDGSHLTFLPEVTRAHLVAACITLFAVPPTKGKVVVDGIFNLICEDSFPKTVNDAYKVLYSRSHLERAKDTTIRSLVIVLLKRLFVDPIGIPQSMAESIVAALGAIERISPQFTKDVLAEKLAPMLSDKNDIIIRRLVAVLSMIPTYWPRLDLAVQTRVRGVIGNIDPSGIQKYRVIAVTEAIPELQSDVTAMMARMSGAGRRKVLASRPARYLLPIVIKEFSTAGSFDSANAMAKSILLPYAPFFTTSDIKELFDSIDENQKAKINQVLAASDMDSALAELARITMPLAQSTGDLWKSNYEKFVEDGYDFSLLKEELQSSGVLVPVVPASEVATEGDEIPF